MPRLRVTLKSSPLLLPTQSAASTQAESIVEERATQPKAQGGLPKKPALCIAVAIVVSLKSLVEGS